MTEFILVRHGETDWNRELRFQGQVDVALNATGREQARRVAECLGPVSVHHLVSSDLARTRQTAESIAHHALRATPLDARWSRALREQDFGAIDGMRVPDIQQRHPEAWEQWIRFDADYAFEGGESTRQLHARAMRALFDLAREHPQQTLVVVTHGGVLDMVYRTARALPLSGPRQSVIPNAGVNRVRIQGEAVEILDWANTRHLAGMPDQPIYDQTKLARPSAA